MVKKNMMEKIIDGDTLNGNLYKTNQRSKCSKCWE